MIFQAQVVGWSAVLLFVSLLDRYRSIDRTLPYMLDRTLPPILMQKIVE